MGLIGAIWLDTNEEEQHAKLEGPEEKDSS
jgi:hypothetical protein